MSEKMTCPGCDVHSSDILGRFRNEEPCPNCGLSARAALEVMAARRRTADEELTNKYTAAVIRADKAETRVEQLADTLMRVRMALVENYDAQG